jgi:arginase family enzyme
MFEPITSVGSSFDSLLESLLDKSRIHVQISLESMDVRFCPGINKKTDEGLTSEEMIEIAFLVGKYPNIKSLSVTDYSPPTEDFRTGRFLANILYHCMLGFKKFRI